MTQFEFQAQLQRLVTQFGPASYSTERIPLIFQEVQNLSAPVFKSMVDRFIGEMRYAPLLPDFREAAATERERSWAIKKKEHADDAKSFFENQYFDNHIRKSICSTIIDRLRGKISDETWNAFNSGVTKLAQGPENKKLSCRHCDETGYVFIHDLSGYEFMYRCFCVAGQSKSKSYQIYEDPRGDT